VQEHRRLGVPVGLRSHVDAGDDDVHLTAGLGERDQTTQDTRHPVHVLGTAVHRDLGARRQGEPLDRDLHLLGEVEGSHHQGTLRLCHRTEGFGRVTEQRHPRHTLGVAVGRGGHQPRNDPGPVLAGRSVDGHETAVVVEVVLGETATRTCDLRDELVGVGGAPGA